MARLLAAHGNDVTIAAAGRDSREPEGFRVVLDERDTLIAEASRADVTIVQGLVMLMHPELRSVPRVVADLYDPINLEVLELFHEQPMRERERQHDGHLYPLIDQLSTADFFICASEKRRDYWLSVRSQSCQE